MWYKFSISRYIRIYVHNIYIHIFILHLLVYFQYILAYIQHLVERAKGGRISWYQLRVSEQANDLHLPPPLFMPESDLRPAS